MATCRDVVVKEEEFYCYICLEIYDKPRTLPCLHSFCHTCLVRYVETILHGKTVFSIPCPVCRVDTPVSKCETNTVENWVQNLPVNFTLVSILGSKSENMSLAEGKCVQCLKDKIDSQATVYCYECAEQLCDKCKEIHKKVTILSSHRLCDIKNREDSVAKLEQLKLLTRCPEHVLEEVRYICRDHDQLCCNECAIVSHRKCDKIVSICKKLGKTDNKVRSSSHKLKELDSFLDQLTNYESQHQSLIQVSKNKLKDKLKNMKRRIDDAYELMERSICEEFDEQSDLILKESKLREEEIEKLKSELKHSMDKMQIAKDLGQKLHLFVLQRSLQNEISQYGDEIRHLSNNLSTDIVQASDNAICDTIEANIADLFCITKTKSYASVPLSHLFLKHASFTNAVKSNLGEQATIETVECVVLDAEQDYVNEIKDAELATCDRGQEDGNKYADSEEITVETDSDVDFDFDGDVDNKVEKLDFSTSTKSYPTRHRKLSRKWKNRRY